MLPRFFLCFSLLVGAWNLFIEPAAADTWIKIGSVQVNAGDTSATFAVPLKDKRFKAIRVAARGRDVVITRVAVSPGGAVRSGNGLQQTVTLARGGQPVDSISIDFRNRLATGATATLDIFGHESELQAAAPSKKKKAKNGGGAAISSHDLGTIGSGGSGSGTGAATTRDEAQDHKPDTEKSIGAAPAPRPRYYYRRNAPAGGGDAGRASDTPGAPSDSPGNGTSSSDDDITAAPRDPAPSGGGFAQPKNGRPDGEPDAQASVASQHDAGRNSDEEARAAQAAAALRAAQAAEAARQAEMQRAARNAAASARQPPAAGADNGDAGRSIGAGSPQPETAEMPSPPPVSEVAPPPPARAAPSRSAAAASEPAGNVCQDKKICTPVGVFFGTDRDAQPKETRVMFGSDRADKLTLGHAFVTVPKARKSGEIPLPSLWDIYVRRVPETGDPARHFTIPPGGLSIYDSEDAFIAAVKESMANAGEFKDHAFVFIHGFRVAFDEALFRTAQIAYDLSGDGVPFGTAFLYSWPSAADASGYLFDEDSARLAIPHLEKFLKLVIDKTGAKHIHLIAHSMGNVPLINALKGVTTAENAQRINQIVLAAPDFDKKEFEKVIAAIAPVADGITLYASSSDYAMKIARRARRVPRAGDATTPPGPAIAAGFDTVDVSALDSSIFSWNHNHYAESTELLADMSRIFRTGVHPPPLRNLSFKPQTSQAGMFWRYVK